ncbi:class I SAM-dependent DNA methyltransferase [Actinomadura sp. WAC 06369]|uniref:class I SAM-dependent DNA methyltransferase n=1 Tax=Actinomadura sp. WAC 06369 TaxID=2203193 RepID=UPI001F466ECB|nr:class I SAM-dependent methyltransferase [Actinomadura sp. WAC 06369]
MIAASQSAPAVYSAAHAEIYDFIHAARGRDWAAEADEYAKLIRARNPEADSLLDVACGTGEHLVRFGAEFGRTEGLELSAAMREIARRKLPGVPLHTADMRDFDLRTGFDAVVCLCFSLAYVRTVAELRGTVASMARHLAPGGVLVVEPWWFPERFVEGFVSAALAQEDGRAVSRLSHTVRDGRLSRMTVRYTVAEPTGIREFTEYETLALFEEREYAAAFTDAGCAVEYLPGGPNGRGLFIGVREGGR